MTAYREIPPAEIDCPRCKKRLPPQDVASDKCGTWISAFAATEVLTDEERRHDPVTRWWRVRAPCPICGEQMLLRGDDPCLLQGCDGHGFWIDADTVEHTTKLRRGVDHAALERKRNDEARLEADQQARSDAERQRAEERERRAQAEAQIGSARATLGWNDDQARDVPRVDAAIARGRVDPHVQAVALKVAEELDRRFGSSRVGGELYSGDYQVLIERIVALELRNEALEARIAALEAKRG